MEKELKTIEQAIKQYYDGAILYSELINRILVEADNAIRSEEYAKSEELLANIDRS